MRTPLTLPLAALAAFLSLPAPAVAETVRLRIGRALYGELGAVDAEGVQFRRWDNGGVMFLPWASLASSEARRLRAASHAEETVARPTAPGVRIVTDSGKVEEGIVVEDTPDRVVLKAGARRPQIPSKSIRSRVAIDLDLEKVYTPDEIYEQKLKASDVASADGNVAMAESALALRLPDKARAHYLRAAELDPARKDAITKLLEGLDRRQKEVEARKLRADIAALAAAGKFAEVHAKLGKLREGFADTEATQDLDAYAQKLQADEEQYNKNRDEFLRKKIVPEWYETMERLVRKKAGDRRATLADAQAYVDSGLEPEVKAFLASKYGIADADIEKYWTERQVTDKRSASFASGSWIREGGASGAVGGGAAGGARQARSALDRLLGGDRRRAQPAAAAGGKRPAWVLQTPEEWWATSPTPTRSEWLEAYYAEKLKLLDKKTKPCPLCNGEGVFHRVMPESSEELPCKRCHGVKHEATVIYQ